MDAVLFYFFAVLAVASAVVVIAQRNPIKDVRCPDMAATSMPIRAACGPPGSITIGRGLERVTHVAVGLQAARSD